MRPMPALALGLLAVSSLLAAASGQVRDPEGKPIDGAEVCNVMHGATMDCVKTDAYGFYHIASPTSQSVFVRASGFRPLVIAAIEQSAPVVLHRAATLVVKVVDAVTGAPVPSGKVILNYTSGLPIGDAAPFNRAGVRISTIEPGTILARTEAEGYEPGGPETVVLREGQETTVLIRMKPAAAPKR
jgi:Carboxypeptidase regulatory-like domain